MALIFIDLTGLELTSEEREILQHPQVGGIVFFSRNYESPNQFKKLVTQIHKLSNHRLLLTIDQEGGRVQRFRNGLTPLPALGKIGEYYARDPIYAHKLAETHAWLMASELLALGIDISFSPVLDLNKRLNPIIGLRAFHADPHIVTKLGSTYIKGMKQAGMSCVGKHFPGHGSVKEDTHMSLAKDNRDFKAIEASDLIPFFQLSNSLNAIMTAHVTYTKIDDSLPCSLSPYCMKILREQLKFYGAVFTDDLSMLAVQKIGDISKRVLFALQAGCDGILVCNHRKDAISALEYTERSIKLNTCYTKVPSASHKRLESLVPINKPDLFELQKGDIWQNAVTLLSKLNDN